MKDAFGNVSTIAVLGGGSDIGTAIATKLVADLGVKTVTLAVRNRAGLDASAIAATVRVVDFDADSVETHADAIDEVFGDGDIDVLVVAFGSLPEEHGLDTSLESVLATARTNYLGAMSATLLAARRLRDQGHGHLVVLSSLAMVRARPDNYLYGSTKAGADFLWRGVSDELDLSGVHTTVVRPGFVRTKMTEGLKSAPFAVGTEDVAEAVVKAVRSSRSGIVWVPGIIQMVALALKLLPVSIIRKMGR